LLLLSDGGGAASGARSAEPFFVGRAVRSLLPADFRLANFHFLNELWRLSRLGSKHEL
jgi:hypothetical protein